MHPQRCARCGVEEYISTDSYVLFNRDIKYLHKDCLEDLARFINTHQSYADRTNFKHSCDLCHRRAETPLSPGNTIKIGNMFNRWYWLDTTCWELFLTWYRTGITPKPEDKK